MQEAANRTSRTAVPASLLQLEGLGLIALITAAGRAWEGLERRGRAEEPKVARLRGCPRLASSTPAGNLGQASHPQTHFRTWVEAGFCIFAGLKTAKDS